ncbi:hypothetical protein MNEG_16058 [Monoraphidium neglectum]|uniref:Uncharacterized protein n=1 Tax=Monoraphidium neglectum TaxID=145388 RepID=A0A0D2LPI0_9CHLO|nr:hypothetical protein MNEG_16058 [Monoraphidium neglectum]KIY91906.1 hypothetical protein MNEG_16058 [Monoraphidium neglectum]|eukprot:XP_013890926.1 hypothetical protein MNEG_16058 [Monoraphidium neglectum]
MEAACTARHAGFHRLGPGSARFPSLRRFVRVSAAQHRSGRGACEGREVGRDSASSKQQLDPPPFRLPRRAARAALSAAASAAAALAALLPAGSAAAAEGLAPLSLDPDFAEGAATPELVEVFFFVVATYIGLMFLYLWLASMIDEVRRGARGLLLCDVSPAAGLAAGTHAA